MGRRIAWVPGIGNDLTADQPPTVEQLETLARAFFDQHRVLRGSWSEQAELNMEASGPTASGGWLIAFRQQIRGVYVEGARYDFHISAGNRVSFGAQRWVEVQRSFMPRLSASEARKALDKYLGASADGVVDLELPELLLIPLAADKADGSAWESQRGSGYAHQLVWPLKTPPSTTGSRVVSTPWTVTAKARGDARD